jgi:formylglycine-generating enzyme required for sulfatase activity
VRELYQKLRAEPWIQPWLDEEELYPGQDWNMEIEKAVEAADAIIVCLTKNSINKEGYVQRELRIVLDFADYKPDGTLYLMPVRLEECEPPRRLRARQYVDYFEGQRERGLQRLLVSLKRRAESLGLEVEMPTQSVGRVSNLAETVAPKREESKPIVEDLKQLRPVMPPTNKITLSNGMEFLCVPAGEFIMGNSSSQEEDEKPQHTVDIPYDYWMGRFPVTNVLFNGYAKSQGIRNPVDGWEKKKDHPVVNVTWVDTTKYCQWVSNLLKSELPSGLICRLPTESEWEKAARGTEGREYPWGNGFDKSKCNVSSNELRSLIMTLTGGTTPVHQYSPRGDSPYGCADMAGNVWEWTHSLKKEYPYNFNDGREDEKSNGSRVLRGGSFAYDQWYARSAYRYDFNPLSYNNRGFRVCLAPPLPK